MWLQLSLKGTLSTKMNQGWWSSPVSEWKQNTEVNRKLRLLRLKNARQSKKKELEDVSSGGRYFAEAMPLETTDAILRVSLQKLYKERLRIRTIWQEKGSLRWCEHRPPGGDRRDPQNQTAPLLKHVRNNPVESTLRWGFLCSFQKKCLSLASDKPQLYI